MARVGIIEEQPAHSVSPNPAAISPIQIMAHKGLQDNPEIHEKLQTNSRSNNARKLVETKLCHPPHTSQSLPVVCLRKVEETSHYIHDSSSNRQKLSYPTAIHNSIPHNTSSQLLHKTASPCLLLYHFPSLPQSWSQCAVNYF